MKPHFLAALVALIFASVGCTTVPTIPEIAQLQWVVHADPVADAKKALASGQHTLLAVWGVTWLIPGVSEPEKAEYRQRYGVKFIEGTGDVLYSEEHARLVRQAYSYAMAYNRHILSQLRNE
jgi:hypothetical protein